MNFIRILCLFIVYSTISIYPESLEQMNQNTNPTPPTKTLVVYYSRTGTTKNIAEEIALKLNADIEQILDKKNRKGIFKFFESGREARTEKLTELKEIKKAPQQYNLIIIGTPIWDENLSTPVRTYLEKYRDKLPEKVAFFTTSRMTEADKIVNKVEKIIGRPVVAFTGFASFPLCFRSLEESSFKGDLSKERKTAIMESFLQSLKQIN